MNWEKDLQAELIELDRMIAETPETDILDLKSLKARKREVEKEFMAVMELCNPPYSKSDVDGLVRAVDEFQSHNSESKVTDPMYPKPCETPCPKCGSMDVERAYFEAGDCIKKNEAWRYTVWSRLDWLESNLVACRKAGSTDHYHDARLADWFEALDSLIIHRCRVCRYEWATPPLKNEESEENDE